MDTPYKLAKALQKLSESEFHALLGRTEKEVERILLEKLYNADLAELRRVQNTVSCLKANYPHLTRRQLLNLFADTMERGIVLIWLAKDALDKALEALDRDEGGQ